MGGAQAIAALAYGTEIGGAGRRDRRPRQPLGPGGQAPGVRAGRDRPLRRPQRPARARRSGSDAEPIALDLLAQAEHGPGTLVVAASTDERCSTHSQRGSPRRTRPAPSAGSSSPPIRTRRCRLAQQFAPEHLQLLGPAAEALAPRITRAGCVFVGPAAATAFGDYIAGSNHILPTGGAGRFASALSVRCVPPQLHRGTDH